MEPKVPETPSSTLEIVRLASQQAQDNVAQMASQLARCSSLIPATAPVFSNLNPFLSLIQSVNEGLRQMVAPIQHAVQVVEQMNQAFLSVTSIIESYRKMQESIREQFQRLAKYINNIRPMEVVESWIDGFQEIGKRLHRYEVLKKARDGDRNAYHQIPQLFPIQFRQYKQLHKWDWSLEDFINLVLMKFMELLQKFQDLEEQAIDILFTFLEKLFFAIQDALKGEARLHHLDRLSRDGLDAAAIEHNGVRYLLIPTLALQMDISESRLKRWARQGLIPAVKLPYCFASGYQEKIWHFPLTKELYNRLKELQAIPERKSKLSILGYMNRQEASKASGVPESTLKFWEKRGIITPERQGRKVLYSAHHLEQLAEMLNQRRQSSRPALQFAF